MFRLVLFNYFHVHTTHSEVVYNYLREFHWALSLPPLQNFSTSQIQNPSFDL